MDFKELLDTTKFRPSHLEFPDSWIGHFPFANWLIKTVKPSILVELGTHTGNSYFSFCQTVKESDLSTICYAVDTWNGDEHAGFYEEEVFTRVNQINNEKYEPFSRLMRMTFDQALDYFPNDFIEVLHIDGMHSYEAVKHDFERWLPKLKPYAVVLFHDTNVRERDFGVWKFWEELKQTYPLFIEFTHSNGLGVIQLSAGNDNFRLDCLKQDFEYRKELIDYFSSLGRNINDQYKIRAETQLFMNRISDYQAQTEQKEQIISTLNSQIGYKDQHIKILQTKLLEYIHNNLIERDQIIKNLNSTLLEIYSSNVWKLVRVMVKFKLWLVPQQSKREKLGRKILGLMSAFFYSMKQLFSNKKNNKSSTITKSGIFEFEPLIGNVDVSIIIPIFNKLEMTKGCLDSIFNISSQVLIEVIVIDNGSSDGTAAWLKEQAKNHENLKIVFLNSNIGFSGAINKGINKATGRFILLLNNDTLVAENFLSVLVNHLENDSSIGIVSPVTNYVGEGKQIDENAKFLTTNLTMINNYAKKISDKEELIFEPNRLVFFCVLIRRELFDLIGQLDENYEKGNYEDDDYCLRTRLAGYRLAIAQNSFVYHYGSTTFNQEQNLHNHWMAENRIKFYKKAGRLSSFTRPTNVHLPNEEKIISVIVRTKNRPHLLIRALTSLVNQTAQVFSVIVINDGGDDITTIIDEFKKFFPIKYIHHKESLGRTEAINSGLDVANGNWIGYLDDDDILYPWHYEALLEYANHEQSYVVYSDYNRSLFTNIHAIEPQKLTGSPCWTFNLNDLLVQNQIPIHSYIHKSEVLKIVKNWNVTFDRLEDYEFLLRVSSLGEFSHVAKVTCEYRFYLDTKNSISLEGRNKYLQALERIYQLYPVYDESLISHRIETISAMQEQNSHIVSIYKKFDNEELAQREVIRLVTGM